MTEVTVGDKGDGGGWSEKSKTNKFLCWYQFTMDKQPHAMSP